MQAVIDFRCDGSTALMLASKRGHMDVVQALIDAGASVSAKNKVRCEMSILKGFTPIAKSLQLMHVSCRDCTKL